MWAVKACFGVVLVSFGVFMVFEGANSQFIAKSTAHPRPFHIFK